MASTAWRQRRHADSRLERLDPGFGLLLDALAMIDGGVERALDGRVPACGRGCAECCSQPIPVAPLELKLLHAHGRVHRLGALGGGGAGKTCPFLGADKACRVYAVRPMACRQFLVFGQPCSPGEDPMTERPDEIFRPDYAVMRAALWHTLPWYADWPGFPGFADPADGQRFLLARTQILQEAWQTVVVSESASLSGSQ